METINKNLLSAALRKAMTDEHMWSHDAAKLLNINPIYVSMMLNSNSFDKAGSTAWKRIEDWFNTNDTLANFKFPEGEAIWKPKEKADSIDYNIQSPKSKKKIKDNVVSKGKEIISETNKPDQPSTPEKTDRGKTTDDKLQKDYLELKSKCSGLELQIALKDKEISNLKELPSAELICTEPLRQKVAIDIEINLVVNGNRINIQI